MLTCVPWVVYFGYGVEVGVGVCCLLFSHCRGAASIRVVSPCLVVRIRAYSRLRFAVWIAACICSSLIGGHIACPSMYTWLMSTALLLYVVRSWWTSQNDTSLMVFRSIPFGGLGTSILPLGRFRLGVAANALGLVFGVPYSVSGSGFPMFSRGRYSIG